MSDHLHLIVVPDRAESLAAALKPVNLRYAQEVNRRHGTSGYLWGGRFFSCPLDEEYFWEAMHYVERNPVRARLVRKPERYRWSSAAGHCGRRGDPLLSDAAELVEEVGDWSEWLREGEDELVVERLRLCTRTGRPAGSASFVRKLERKVGRRLRALPVGRPRKKRTPRSRKRK